MEEPGYVDGDIITFLNGINTLTLYNAEENGSIIFDISFSSASTLI